jgi:hypothetical protein
MRTECNCFGSYGSHKVSCPSFIPLKTPILQAHPHQKMNTDTATPMTPISDKDVKDAFALANHLDQSQAYAFMMQRCQAAERENAALREENIFLFKLVENLRDKSGISLLRFSDLKDETSRALNQNTK